VSDWLAHHGGALVRRFDPMSYSSCSTPWTPHVGVGRGRACAGGTRIPLLAVAVDSDQLYPVDVVGWRGRCRGARWEQLRSPHGHDAFLIDQRGREHRAPVPRARLARREGDATAARSLVALREASVTSGARGTLRAAGCRVIALPPTLPPWIVLVRRHLGGLSARTAAPP
jgi:hypothetical protein